MYINWTAIMALCAIGALIIELLYRIPKMYRERKERIIKDKEEIYEPLNRDVELLINSVKIFEEEICKAPPMFWKTLKGRVSSDLYRKLEELFEKRFREYCSWLKASQDFIRYKIYFYVDMHLRKLDEEFKNLGVGSFEYKLYGSLVLPILHGESMSLTWFKEHDLNLWEDIEKCPHSNDIRSLFEWLKESNPCIESLRKTQKNLTEFAENLKDELKRKIT